MGRVLDRRQIISAALFTLFLTITSFAQQAKVLAPHKPIAPRFEKQIKWLTPPAQRSMVGGLWMTDANYKSSIYIRNVVETDPVTVTPILYLSNGTKYTLPQTTVEPAGIAIISINDALQKQGISSFATLSGYVELQYIWPWDPFCATVRNVDTAHSLIFTYGLRSTKPQPLQIGDSVPPVPTHVVEGMWWKQESNVTGFVALANLSSQSVKASIEVTDAQAKSIGQHDATVSPHGMKLIHLDELRSASATLGGVRVTSKETMDKLVVNGGLEDQAVGYSSIMPLTTQGIKAKAEPVTIAEIGLMTGAADPMMQFPAGTTFTPYSVLRNVSDGPISLTPTLWWMESGAPRSAPLPPVRLQAYESQSLDVSSLLMQFGPKNFNGSFNLVIDGEARSGSLIMSSGSVDQTNSYVFEVGPRGVGEGTSKSLQYWSTGNGDDTMVTVWNPADEVQDFSFTLYFTGGHYTLPLHLEPRATRNLNISEIIQNQLPDAEGNIIPAAVHEGTAKIAGSQAENEAILVAIQAGIYNVRKATCGQVCDGGCSGYVAAAVVISPFTITAGGTKQLNLVATYISGGTTTLPASWSSSDTNVATVSTGTGLVTGVGAGSVTITATSQPNQPVGVAPLCHSEVWHCPTATFGGSGSGTVLQACPTSVAVANSTTFSLASQFPALKTGIGIGTAMQVSPTSQSWNGTQIAESLVTNINTCPANFGNLCSGSSIFTVGAGAGNVYGINFPAAQNIYYDFHATVASTSLLNAPGAPNSCTASCTQHYSCNGNTIGNFTVVRSFTKGQIQGTPVTKVGVTKNPQ